MRMAWQVVVLLTSVQITGLLPQFPKTWTCKARSKLWGCSDGKFHGASGIYLCPWWLGWGVCFRIGLLVFSVLGFVFWASSVVLSLSLAIFLHLAGETLLVRYRHWYLTKVFT